MPDVPTPRGTPISPAEVVREFADDALEFVSRETKYILQQMRRGAKEAIASGGLGFAAGALVLSGYTVLSISAGMYLARGKPRGPLVTGAVTLGAGAVLAVAAWRRLPRWLVSDTTASIRHDVDALRGAFI